MHAQAMNALGYAKHDNSNLSVTKRNTLKFML